MAKSAEADPASMHHRRPHIGAFVLETLRSACTENRAMRCENISRTHSTPSERPRPKIPNRPRPDRCHDRAGYHPHSG